MNAVIHDYTLKEEKGAEAGGKLDHYVLIARKNLPIIFVETLKSFPDTFSQLSGFAFVLGA